MEEGQITPQKETPEVVETPPAPMKKRQRDDEEEELSDKTPKTENSDRTPPTLPWEDEELGGILSQEHAHVPLPPFDVRLAEEGMREEQRKRASDLSSGSRALIAVADIYLSAKVKKAFGKETISALFTLVQTGDIFEHSFEECYLKRFFMSSGDEFSLEADQETIELIRTKLDDDVRQRLVQLGCDLLKEMNQ